MRPAALLALALVLAPGPGEGGQLRLSWTGGGTDQNPGTWTIQLIDAEPGAAGGYAVDGGPPVPFGPAGATVPVPSAIGVHEIVVTALGDLSLSDERAIVDDDPTPPRLTVEYAGGGTRNYPGVWMLDLFDPESPQASGTYRINDGPERRLVPGSSVVAVPYYAGRYTITVTVTNNDRDHPDDEDTLTITDTREVR